MVRRTTFLGVILDAQAIIPYDNSGRPVTIQEQGALIAHELNHLNRIVLFPAVSPFEKTIGERFAKLAEDKVTEQLRGAPDTPVEQALMALRGEVPAFLESDEILWDLGLLTGPIQRAPDRAQTERGQSPEGR